MKNAHGTLLSYTIGFVVSLALTLTAYYLVNNQVLSGNGLLAAILSLAMVQLIVQLVFFLHLGREGKPHLNMIAFLFMLMVLVIIVFGSLWIMNHLNYHTMTPQQTDKYLLKDEGLEPPSN